MRIVLCVAFLAAAVGCSSHTHTLQGAVEQRGTDFESEGGTWHSIPYGSMAGADAGIAESTLEVESVPPGHARVCAQRTRMGGPCTKFVVVDQQAERERRASRRPQSMHRAPTAGRVIWQGLAGLGTFVVGESLLGLATLSWGGTSKGALITFMVGSLTLAPLATGGAVYGVGEAMGGESSFPATALGALVGVGAYAGMTLALFDDDKDLGVWSLFFGTVLVPAGAIVAYELWAPSVVQGTFVSITPMVDLGSEHASVGVSARC